MMLANVRVRIDWPMRIPSWRIELAEQEAVAWTYIDRGRVPVDSRTDRYGLGI